MSHADTFVAVVQEKVREKIIGGYCVYVCNYLALCFDAFTHVNVCLVYIYGYVCKSMYVCLYECV